MSSVLYAIFVVAILFIIYWYVQNERAGTDGSKGLLAMRAPKDASAVSADEDVAGARRPANRQTKSKPL